MSPPEYPGATLKSNVHRRKAWFDRGARALKSVAAVDGEIYACPICFRGFSSDALGQGLLTEDHVPPESLGGRPLVLSCRECNNRAGHAFESHMEKLDARLAFNRGQPRRPVRMKLRAWESTLRVMARGDDKTLTIDLGERGNNPADRDAHLKHLDEASRFPLRKFEFQMSFDDQLDMGAARKGWLRSAYLVAFAAFGYHYAIHPQVRRLVESLQESGFRADNYVFLDGEASLPANQILILKDPTWLEGHISISFGRCAIMLPGRRTPDPTFEQGLARLRDNSETAIHGRIIKWPRGLELRLDLPD